MDNESYGFIILRHVNSKKTNLYWQECYDCIRKFHPENKIIIIDDASKYEYITPKDLRNTTLIQSEYPGRGELLPYYYFLQTKFVDTVCILHDSAFLNGPVKFNTVNLYTILWDFDHLNDQIEDERRIINSLNNSKLLLKFHENKSYWKGCFGGMTIITYLYLKHLDKLYDFSKLLDYILNRYNRMSFERIIACMLQSVYKPQPLSLLGNIANYGKSSFTYTYDEYLQNNKQSKLPIIKVWSGR